MSDPWNRIWSREFTHAENRRDIEKEIESIRWKRIHSTVSQRFGSFKGLRVMEIGSGRGIYSLLFSLEGSQSFLLDREGCALKKAAELFDEWGQGFQGIVADAFAPPSDLIGTFDVAMSFGLAEHFRYPERFKIFESHLRWLKPEGQLIVSVPNAVFLPYRIGKYLLEKLHKWELGLEIPFSRGELKQTAQDLHLKNWKIVGSGLVNDTLNFWLTQRIIHLPGLFWDRSRSVAAPGSGKRYLPLKERFHDFAFNPATPLDDFLGYALVLMGQKS